MSIFKNLREAAEKSARTNFEVYNDLVERRRLSPRARMNAAGATLGVGGIFGVMGSSFAVGMAKLGTDSALIAALGKTVIGAGTVAVAGGSVYLVPAIALGTAAIGAVGLLTANRFSDGSHDERLRAKLDPNGRAVTGMDWVRGVKRMVSDSIREAFGPKPSKATQQFFQHIRDGNTTAVEKMIRADPRIMYEWSEKGGSSLATAIVKKQTGVAEVLLRHGMTLQTQALWNKPHTMRDLACAVGDASYVNMLESIAAHYAHENPGSAKKAAVQGARDPFNTVSLGSALLTKRLDPAAAPAPAPEPVRSADLARMRFRP